MNTVWRRRLAAVVGGLGPTLALAPFNYWPLAIIGCALLLSSLRYSKSPLEAFSLGWLFGAGMFGSGASWVYVSINEHGNAAPPLAIFLTASFCLGLALLPAAMSWALRRLVHQRNWWFAFPALWVLFEWLRSWLLTGFPWLYLGYSTIDTWLAGWAPLIGVLGLSLILATMASGVVLAVHERRYSLLAATFLLWPAGLPLLERDWVTPGHGDPITVAMVQANIPQELKWNPDYYQPTLSIYRDMTEPHLGVDVLLWPEAAIPRYFQRATDFIEPMAESAAASNTALITGIPYISADGKGYHNSIVALGAGSGAYHKQRLVPFGEYVPLEPWLRGLIDFFNLPMSHFSPGEPDQARLTAGEISIAPFICYEIVYPELVRRQAQVADVFITISNDSWFGASIGPLQHLEMARMRALENGRYVLRATNNGVSAIIDEKGRILDKTAQFKAATLSGSAKLMTGTTPFSNLGSWPVLAICFALMIAATAASRAESQKK